MPIPTRTSPPAESDLWPSEVSWPTPGPAPGPPQSHSAPPLAARQPPPSPAPVPLPPIPPPPRHAPISSPSSPRSTAICAPPRRVTVTATPTPRCPAPRPCPAVARTSPWRRRTSNWSCCWRGSSGRATTCRRCRWQDCTPAAQPLALSVMGPAAWGQARARAPPGGRRGCGGSGRQLHRLQPGRRWPAQGEPIPSRIWRSAAEEVSVHWEKWYNL